MTSVLSLNVTISANINKRVVFSDNPHIVLTQYMQFISKPCLKYTGYYMKLLLLSFSILFESRFKLHFNQFQLQNFRLIDSVKILKAFLFVKK